MQNKKLILLVSSLLLLFLPGCGVIVGIFKAGFWTAVVLVIIIVALVVYGFKKLSGR